MSSEQQKYHLMFFTPAFLYFASFFFSFSFPNTNEIVDILISLFLDLVLAFWLCLLLAFYFVCLLHLFLPGNSYRDILHCNKKPFYVDLQEDSNVMDAYVMHSVSASCNFLFSLEEIKARHFVNMNHCFIFCVFSLIKFSMQLNHVLKTRHIVSKNDAKVSKHEEHVKLEILPSDSLLDQGFTRPKVYLLF